MAEVDAGVRDWCDRRSDLHPERLARIEAVTPTPGLAHTRPALSSPFSPSGIMTHQHGSSVLACLQESSEEAHGDPRHQS